MSKKMKAKVIKKNVTKYFVEINTGDKKLLVGKGENNGFFKHCEWDTEQEAIDYINSKEQLELEKV